MTAGVIRTQRPSARQRAVSERARKGLRRRRAVNGVMLVVLATAAVVTVLPLVFILFHLVAKGATSLDVAFFTHMPKPVGEAGGGMANAIVGTLIVIGLAMAFGLPVGVGAGLYLAENRGAWLANSVRFLSDVLNGLPSIVMGIFAWQFLVRPVGHFSALSGGVALGAMMIPMIARTTEEMVRLVPSSLREASLALGIRWWVTSLRVILRTATAGVITGIMLAIARIGGETAPLLFTAFNNQYWQAGLDQPISTLTVQLFTYSIAPYDDWHRQAWAAALVLMTITLLLNVAARAAGRQRFTLGR